MSEAQSAKGNPWREIVEACIRRELQRGAAMPAPDEDMVESGALDSMAWVSVLRAIETATGIRDLGDGTVDVPRSVSAILAALEQAAPRASTERQTRAVGSRAGAAAAFAGWGAATGARRVAVRDVEREFRLPARKIAKGAGIESVARVSDDEDECTLAMRACEAALRAAGTDIATVECLIATSETHLGYPSLGALLHARLLAEPRTAVFDVGGGCLGLVNGLALAQGLIAAGNARCVLVATADVHSRVLTPARVPGEFGGLFGDGASAFVLTAEAERHGSYRLGEFLFGCDPTAASAIRVGLKEHVELDVTFNGENLARAAVSRLQELIEDLELRSGASRKTAEAFATHQPNPRLVGLLARQLKVPREKFPPVARTCGNLGSSTCGVALCHALAASTANGKNGPIFVASLGPGLLFGGVVLS